MRKILFLISIIFCFFACKKVEKQAASGGKIAYNTENYTLKTARCSNFGKETSEELNTMNLFFASPTIKIDENGMSGTGAILALATFSLSDTLPKGIYNVEDFIAEKNILKENSYLQIISKDDTLTIYISSGYMLVENDLQLKNRFEFHFAAENGDSIIGSFAGAMLYNVMYDKPAIAQISVDTVDYQIQKSDFVSWGKLLADELYYYEIYFYSTNLRRTDTGKIKSGFVLILGIHSLSGDYPQNGTYAVSRNYENNTLLWGTKIGSVRWGTYWNLYANGSSATSSNVIFGEISFEKSENYFKIILNLKDQNNKPITGEYNSELNIKEVF